MSDNFVSVPETMLPDGRLIPAFQVGQFLSSRNLRGQIAINAGGWPWVRINYKQARKVSKDAGYRLITESQALALAIRIAGRDENWTGGKVGAGMLYQGLRKDTLQRAMPGSYASKDNDERRWFMLPGGERIYDVAGNAYTWVFDDVQGDKDGLVAKPFEASSPSLMIPRVALDKGDGNTAAFGNDWTGHALLRGGCWRSLANAGVFSLDHVGPDERGALVGFRCTR